MVISSRLRVRILVDNIPTFSHPANVITYADEFSGRKCPR
jgi:hypothetical protein